MLKAKYHGKIAAGPVRASPFRPEAVLEFDRCCGESYAEATGSARTVGPGASRFNLLPKVNQSYRVGIQTLVFGERFVM